MYLHFQREKTEKKAVCRGPSLFKFKVRLGAYATVVFGSSAHLLPLIPGTCDRGEPINPTQDQCDIQATTILPSPGFQRCPFIHHPEGRMNSKRAGYT